MSDIISLPARLDSVALSALSLDLTRACSEKAIRIDASEVTHMGALAAQMLLSAARTVCGVGGTLEFVAISKRATDQLTTMGLAPATLTEGAP